MTENNSNPELLKRKFEPISDWKPAESTSSNVDKMISEAVKTAQKSLESLGKSLEPYSEEATNKIKEMASSLDGVVGKSSKEARSWLSKTLETLAEKVKPD
jgi:uncharacterized protein with gpF-like domain